MDFNEFIKITKDIESQSVYAVFCEDCITYAPEPGFEGTIRGLMDGRIQEFSTLKKAKSAIALHAKQMPLHKPWLNKHVQTEYILRDQRHMTRYRRSGDSVHVYSVDGLSRYKIVEWSNLLRGLKNDFIVDVQRYMQSTQVFFPLIICSYIFGKKLIPEFYPAEISELDT